MADKEVKREYDILYRKENKDYQIERHKEYYLTNHDRLLKRRRENNWKNNDIHITVEEYEILLIKQEHKCAICKIHDSKLEKALCVDHNHKTGEIRGLVCPKCNRAIGLLNDDSKIAEQMAIYLR